MSSLNQGYGGGVGQRDIIGVGGRDKEIGGTISKHT